MSDGVSLLDWTEEHVCSWLHDIGFGQYDQHITSQCMRSRAPGAAMGAR